MRVEPRHGKRRDGKRRPIPISPRRKNRDFSRFHPQMRDSKGAVYICCCGSCQSRQEAALRADVIAFALEHAAPAEIVWEIFRGHAIEPAHPGFEAAVIGVDVLNMKDAPAAFAA